MAEREFRGAVGGYFPYSFPRSRGNFFRACIFFDQVELFLPNPVDGYLVPEYDRKHLRASFEALERFTDEVAPLVKADAVKLVMPGRPEGFVGNSRFGEEFWWQLGDEPYQAGPITEHSRRAQLSYWWPVVADMGTEPRLIPYTDDGAAHAWLADRLRSIRPETSEVASAWDELAVGSGWLGLETLKVEAPHLTPGSVEQVLEMRERLGPELVGFRQEMETLSAKLAVTPWDPGFAREVVRIVAGDVEPSLRELRRRSEDLRKTLKSKSLSAVIHAAPLPIMTTVLVGVPVEFGLALAGGVGLAEVMDEYRRTKAELRRNGLALLLDGD